MINKLVFRKYFFAVLPMFIIAGIGFSPLSAVASTIGLLEAGKPGVNFGRPANVPPINPPIDTPAFYNGLANTPDIPANVPSHTLPGSNFGQSTVPVPAAVWLFGSGLLALVGIARIKSA
jgi:hypothetical protein